MQDDPKNSQIKYQNEIKKEKLKMIDHFLYPYEMRNYCNKKMSRQKSGHFFSAKQLVRRIQNQQIKTFIKAVHRKPYN